MTDISTTGVFACLAASALSARLLPPGSFIGRTMPLIFVVPAAFFAFRKIEIPAPEWLNTAILIVALLAMVIDGFLKFNGSDHGFSLTDSAR